MKTRNGFVSNSSSSSFIVAFDKIPNNIEELQILLFGNEKTLEKYSYSITTSKAAETIWSLMQEQIKVRELLDEKIKKEFELLAFSIILEVHYLRESAIKVAETFVKESLFYKEYAWLGVEPHILYNLVFPQKVSVTTEQNLLEIRKAEYKQKEEEAKILYKTLYNTFKEKTFGKELFFFKFHDNSPEGTILENRNIFKNLYHQRIDHH